MLLTVKDLSQQLKIKETTLYNWAAHGKIPCQKIHGLIRFDPDAIRTWLQSFKTPHAAPTLSLPRQADLDVDRIIEAAKREVYTPGHGETKTPSPTGKE